MISIALILCFVVTLSPVTPAFAVGERQDPEPPNPINPLADSTIYLPMVTGGSGEGSGQSTDLEIVKTSSEANVAPNQAFSYTITVTNHGPGSASGVVATETLPGQVTLDTAAPSQGSYNSTTNTWTVGNLASGGSATLTLSVTAQPAASGTLTNQVSVTGGQTDPVPGNNTSTVNTPVTITPVQDADLEITKTSSTSGVTPTQSFTYLITVTNHGPAAATNVVAAETLSSKLTLNLATPSVGTYNTGTNQWTIPSLANGASATLTLSVTVKSGQTGTITNQVAVTCSQNDPNTGNNSDAVNVTISSTASAPRSDDFNYYPGLKTFIWSFVNPLSDAQVRVDGSHVRLTLPAGVAHKAWSGGVNNAPRILQSVQNVDFEIEAKFDSRPSGTYAAHGITAEQDSNDFIRFEFFSYGTNTLYMYASKILNGVEEVILETDITSQINAAPMYLRINRQGANWTLTYSANGVDWSTFTTFTQSYTVQRVGLYTGNSGTTIPGYEMVADYFFNTASPISPEDPIHPSFIKSDDFNTSSLNTGLWTLTNPSGGEIMDFTGTQVKLYASSAAEHDIWDGTQIFAPRLMQTANNRSFEIEAKFDSTPSGTYTAQGLLVQQDDNDLLEYYVYSFGTTLRIFAALVVDGVEQQPYLVDTNIPTSRITAAPMYLRINRSGNFWTLSYSGNGTDWWTAVTFNRSMVVNQVGVVVGNQDDPDTGILPGFLMIVDYFQNNAMPINPHD